MADPNVYQGPGSGGTHKRFVNIAAEGCDNTGGSDIGPTCQAVAAACTKSGQSAWLPAGSYLSTTPASLPSGARVRGQSSAAITSNNPNHGAYDEVFFSTFGTPIQVGAIDAAYVAPVNPGNTLPVDFAAAPIVGHVLLVSATAGGASGTCQTAYIIKNVVHVAGTEYTVTLDRPNVWPFIAADTVTEYASLPHNVIIDGEGMTFAGTGLQAIEYFGMLQGRIRDCHYVSSASNLSGSAFGVDCASRECTIEDCTSECPNGSAGGYLQSNERTVISRFRSDNGGAAFNLFDCYQCGIEDSWSYNSTTGNDFLIGQINPGSGRPASFGCTSCWISGGGVVNSGGNGYYVAHSTSSVIKNVLVQGAAINGVTIDGGCVDTSLMSVTVSGATGKGVAVLTGAFRTRLHDISATGCDVGLYVQAGTDDTFCRNLYITGCVTQAVSALDELTIVGMSGGLGATDGVNYIIANAGNFTMADSDLSSVRANGTMLQNAGATAKLDNIVLTLTVGANQTGFYLTAGTTYLTNCKVTGPGSSFGCYIQGAGTVVHIGPGCDFDGSGTPLTLAGGTTLTNVTMDQTGGVALVAATRSLTFAEHYTTRIELAAGALGDATVTTYPIPGMTWLASNPSAHNLTMQTTVAGTVVILAGKSQWVQVNSSGVMVPAGAAF